MGEYTSLALDSAGHAYISYYDRLHGDLKVIDNHTGSWVPTTVDGGPADVGQYTSIAVDSEGHPHVSYVDVSNTALKYAEFDGSDWYTETLDATGVVDDQTSMTLDPASSALCIGYFKSDTGTVHTACYHPAEGWSYRYVYGPVGGDVSLEHHDNNGAVCYVVIDPVYQQGLVCEYNGVDHPDSSAADWGPNMGWYNSLDIVGYDLVISYVDRDLHRLKLAWLAVLMEQWGVEVVDDSGTTDYETSLSVEQSGPIHISYYDATNGNLKYATKPTNWDTMVVDGQGGADVGRYSSIDADWQDYPQISYYDATNQALKWARRVWRYRVYLPALAKSH